MAKNTGTLITSAIRPNDSNDPIASAFSSEIKGGLHTVETLSERDSIIIERRDWGMMCYVSDENKTYQLKYNYVSTDIMNNYNWAEFNVNTNVGNEWISSVISVIFQIPATYSVGDRYLAGTNPNDSLIGDWYVYSPGIVLEWDSVNWISTIPTNGMSVRVDDQDNIIYRYEGDYPTGQWNKESLAQVRSIDATSNNGEVYTAYSPPDFEDYARDIIFITKFDTVNIGSTVSININSLGPVEVKKPSPSGLASLIAGDITTEITYSLIYNGSVFELVKHYAGEGAINTRYYIEFNRTVVVPIYHQYWVYGNLTIDGEMINYGQVIIANGSLVNSHKFFNYGDLLFVSFDAGTASGGFLSVGDYDTGQTFPNVASIKFRGGSVTTPDGPIDSVTLTPGAASEVIVWIPAPNYADYFSPTLYTSSYNRYISKPSNNIFTQSTSAGDYGIGDWDTEVDFNSSITREVLNESGTIVAFSDTDFACFNLGTTMSFVLYDHNGDVLQEISDFNINSISSTSSGDLTLNITDFQQDSDRYKATVNGEIDVNSSFVNGGRFNWSITHYNNEGDGNISAGVYSYTKSSVFYESPYQLNATSTAKINGTSSFDENTLSVKKYSGVSFYDINSTFGVTVSDIDLVNEITFPDSKQIDILFNNMAITNTYPGHSDGSTSYGDEITGWDINWNVNNLTYSVIATVNQTNVYIPGFIDNNTNLISTTPNSYIRSRIYDYGLSDTNDSSSELMLFDTFSPSSVTYNNNPINSENGRLSTTDVMNSGTASFDSNSVLASDELQYIFGRIIYPQSNFNQFLPSDNNSVDYTSLTGSNKTFNVYTDLGFASYATASFSFNDYRWFVSSYGKDSSYNTSFANGIFTFNSNFIEEDLHYDAINDTSGNEDLVILIGIDSLGFNSKPDSFLFLSGDTYSYPGRSAATTYNLNESNESSKKMQFTFGSIPIPVAKVWLFIGYKNTNRGKNLRIQNISLI